MIDQQLVPLRELAQLIPPLRRPNGALRRPSVQTLYRWSLWGCRGVRLETMQLGATRCSCLEMYRRFCDEITAARDERRHEMTSQRAAAGGVTVAG